MRVAEIIGDFRNLQYYLSALQVSPNATAEPLDGYSLLRACIADGRATLASAYTHASIPPRGDAESEKAQLKLYVTVTR
jgi:hypothetical protein